MELVFATVSPGREKPCNNTEYVPGAFPSKESETPRDDSKMVVSDPSTSRSGTLLKYTSPSRLKLMYSGASLHRIQLPASTCAPAGKLIGVV